jgi:hypothetical protein
MKPLKGRHQTATQVKVLSPVKLHIKEVDSFHLLEDKKNYFEMVRNSSLFRGLRPWYDVERKLQELGISELFPKGRIFINNLKKRVNKEDGLEVGLIHIRGVAGIITCAVKQENHSKGLALLCKGIGRHSLTRELD